MLFGEMELEMSNEMDFEKELDAEVAKRLGMMEEPGYEFPERMRKSDFAIAGAIAVVCLVIFEIATLSVGVI